jgi:glycosyltransferase involved in cell wall biosynthesis
VAGSLSFCMATTFYPPASFGGTQFACTTSATRGADGRRRPYFLYVGRLVKLKGVHTLIERFRNHPADLVVAGDGDYLSRTELLRKAVAGRLDWYLRLRERGAGIRRLARRDHVSA